MIADHQSAGASQNIPRVYINGRFTTQPMTGLQRYATEIARRLTTSDRDVGSGAISSILLTPTLAHSGRVYRTLWEQVFLLSRSFDGILFSPSNAGPWLHPRHLVVIHDVRASDTKWNSSIPMLTRGYSRLSLEVLSRTAKQFLTVSNYSKQAIVENYSIAEEKITVVYPGADHILDTLPDFDILRKLDLKPNKYVLAVNSLLPHKNMAILYSVDWAQYGLQLCIVGTVPQAKSDSFARVDSRSIIYAGRVSDAEVRALYTQALIYIFPSLYEGFGIPPLEAMNCGCPVVASNSTSIPEVCGDGALYFDPRSAEALDSTLKMILTEPRRREEMVERGYKRARLYKWDTCASKVANVIKEMSHSMAYQKRGRA